MSRMVAPEERKDCRVGRRAVESGVWRPPSEKESGVRFRMAMRWVFRVGERDVMGGRKGASGVRGESGAVGRGRFSRWALKVGVLSCGGRVSLGIRLRL